MYITDKKNCVGGMQRTTPSRLCSLKQYKNLYSGLDIRSLSSLCCVCRYHRDAVDKMISCAKIIDLTKVDLPLNLTDDKIIYFASFFFSFCCLRCPCLTHIIFDPIILRRLRAIKKKCNTIGKKENLNILNIPVIQYSETSFFFMRGKIKFLKQKRYCATLKEIRLPNDCALSIQLYQFLNQLFPFAASYRDVARAVSNYEIIRSNDIKNCIGLGGDVFVLSYSKSLINFLYYMDCVVSAGLLTQGYRIHFTTQTIFMNIFFIGASQVEEAFNSDQMVFLRKKRIFVFTHLLFDNLLGLRYFRSFLGKYVCVMETMLPTKVFSDLNDLKAIVAAIMSNDLPKEMLEGIRGYMTQINEFVDNSAV